MPRDAAKPTWGYQPTNPLPRFFAKVAVESDSACWRWMGSVTATGYGRFSYQSRATWAHRASWQMFRGFIPEGMEIDHTCRNRRCVNPKHLEPVSHRENVRRAADRPTCQRGHLWTSESTITDRKGHRRCRICANEYQRLFRQERRRPRVAAWQAESR